MSGKILKRMEKGQFTRRDFLKGAGLAAGTVALTSVAGFRSFGQGPVTIGAMHPMTGALAEFGQPEVNADLLAMGQLNEAAGRELLKLEFADTQTAPAPAVPEANRLVDVLGVPALVGCASSGVSISVAQSVTIPKEVLQISYASTSVLITDLKDNDFFFRTCPSDKLQGAVAGQFAYNDLSFRTAATMYVNNPYGQGLSNVFANTFRDLGGEVLAEVPHPEEVQPSYVAELQRAVEGNPDVVFLPTYPGQAVIFMKEAIEQFGFNSWLFTDGTKSVKLPEEIGADNVEGMYGTVPGTALKKAFEEAYVAEYGELPPIPFLDCSYDAVALVGLATFAVQTEGKKISGPALRDRLRSLANPNGEPIEPGLGGFSKAFQILSQGGDINYEGAAGTCDFDEHGDTVTPVGIWQFQDGVPVMLEKRSP